MKVYKSATMDRRKVYLNFLEKIVKDIPYKSSLIEGVEIKQTLTKIQRK